MFQAVAMLVSTILNAILDPIFIHFIGFHGAAIATLLSQVICLAFMLIYLKVAVCHIIGFSRGVQSFQNSRKKSLKQNSYKEGENYCHAERCGNQN